MTDKEDYLELDKLGDIFANIISIARKVKGKNKIRIINKCHEGIDIIHDIIGD
jgi:hypothetical protein